MKCEFHFIFFYSKRVPLRYASGEFRSTCVQKHVEVFIKCPRFVILTKNEKSLKIVLNPPPRPISRLVEVISVAILRTPKFGLGRFKLACHIELLYALMYVAMSLLRLGYCEYGYTQYTYSPTYCFEDIWYLEKAALRLHIASACKSSPNSIRYSSLQTRVPCNWPRTAVPSSDGLPSKGQ